MEQRYKATLMGPGRLGLRPEAKAWQGRVCTEGWSLCHHGSSGRAVGLTEGRA